MSIAITRDGDEWVLRVDGETVARAATHPEILGYRQAVIDSREEGYLYHEGGVDYD